jgi:hypothetical protein
MAEIIFEVLFGLAVQLVGRGVLWGIYLGRRNCSEFSDLAADAAGLLFWLLLIGGIVVVVKVFG